MSVGIIMGNVIGVYEIVASLTPSAVLTITAVEQTFTVTGLRVGDCVIVNPPGVTAGAVQTAARVSSANTLALSYVNPTAGTVTPLAGNHTITVFRPERGAAATTISD